MSDDIADKVSQDFADAWIAKVGDKIVGKVVEISEGWSDQSESYYPIITIHDENSNEDKAVHAFWVALQRELMKWQPSIGERIAIIYKEDKPNKIKGRKPVKIFRVQVEGRSINVWDKMKQQRQTVTTPVQQTAETSISSDDDEDTPF
jgi:hypothetical protein